MNLSPSCLCETWTNSPILNSWLSIVDYSLFRLDCKNKRKGGGLCIYTKAKYMCNDIKYNYLNVSNNDDEMLVLDLCLPATKPIVVNNCHRPPSG